MDLTLEGALTKVVQIEDASQVGHARRTAQQLVEMHRFSETDAGRVALVVTELASNILKHAGHGELHLRMLPRPGKTGFEVIAVDRAGGFDRATCMTDGFSTGGTQGIGLGAVSRQADVFDLHADERGTVLLARIFRTGDRDPDLRYGINQHSLHNDPHCGDSWLLAMRDGNISALVVDGLGHGIEAEQAALAGREAFALLPFAAPQLILEEMHYDMTGTRGGAVGIAQYDATLNRLRFTGIGNIGASLVAPDKVHGMASHPGIVGAQYRKAHSFDYAPANGNLLIMYSDGLQSRWNLSDYPGLVFCHPAVIAAVLHRDFCRGRDDVTVLVVALEPAQ